MIYIIEGPPRHGKTVFATLLAMESMREKTTRATFTSWPVYDLKTKKFSQRWERRYVHVPIFDSNIFVDEAHMWYPSRGSGKRYAETINSPGVTLAEHHMWATNGHNGNDFYFISQSINRLDTIIREIYNILYQANRKQIPIIFRLPVIGSYLDFPINFTIKGYHDETFIAKNEPCVVERLWNLPFCKVRRVFKSYNTHFFRNTGTMNLDDFARWKPGDDVKQYVLSSSGVGK